MWQFLYDLYQWKYFGVLAIVWTIIDLLWIKRWQSLLERAGKLIIKPSVFEQDLEPNDPLLYPRRFLEQLATNSRRETTLNSDYLTNNKAKNGNFLTYWVDTQMKHLFDMNNSIKPIGYLISSALFIFFILADAITVANTMSIMGILTQTLPPLLQRLDLSILGGTLLSFILGMWTFIESSGKGIFINADSYNLEQRRILKSIAAMTSLIAVVSMIILAIQRSIVVGDLHSSETNDLILSFIMYGLMGTNNSLAAALVFTSSTQGFLLIIILAVILIKTILPVLAFIIDVFWRMIYILSDIAVWFLLTPFIIIPNGISKIFGLISQDEQKT